MIPYSRPQLSDFYTLFESKLAENHTLHSGTYLYSSYMGVPPPPPFDHFANGIHQFKKAVMFYTVCPSPVLIASKCCTLLSECAILKNLKNQSLKLVHPIYGLTSLAPVVQRPDNFIRWIRHSSASKIYFTLNVVQGFCTPPN